MRRTFLFVFLMMAAMVVFSQREMNFVVEGPEKTYNQIRVVNETSFEDFNCRVVVLNEDKTVNYVYGTYELKEKWDSDSNTNGRKKDRIKQGTRVGIQFPKSFTGKPFFYVEYRDYPLFDVIVIHLTDKEKVEEEYE